MSWLKDFTTYRGRLGRQQAFIRYGVIVAVAVVIQAMSTIGLSAFDHAHRIAPSALLLAVSYPAYSIVVRRVHDVGLSGWWLAPFIGLGLLFSIPLYSEQRFDMWFSPWSLGLQAAIGVASLAVLMWRGTEGENRFGPPPQPTVLDRALAKVFGARFD